MPTDRRKDKQKYIYVYNRVTFSLNKRKGVLSHAAQWMDLEDILQNDISHSQKDTQCTILHT